MCLQPQISQPKLGQIGHVGGVLKTSGPADSKSVPGFNNWPRFVGVIEQKKISNSYENYCIWSSFSNDFDIQRLNEWIFSSTMTKKVFVELLQFSKLICTNWLKIV